MKVTMVYENGEIGERYGYAGYVADIEKEIAADAEQEDSPFSRVVRVWVSVFDDEEVDVENDQPNLWRKSADQPFRISEGD